MKINLKQTLLLCGLAVMLAAFPVFGQSSSESVNEIRLNRKPLTDFADFVIEQTQTNKLDLSENFLVEIEGELTKDGKFDVEKTKYIRTEGNETMIGIAKRAFEAINDSGFFQYLAQSGAEKTNILFSQDNEQFYAIIKTNFVSQRRAQSIRSSYSLLVTILEAQRSGTTSQNEKDDLTLLSGMIIENEGKTVSIKFALTKTIAQEMLQRNLNKRIDDKTPRKARK